MHSHLCVCMRGSMRLVCLCVYGCLCECILIKNFWPRHLLWKLVNYSNRLKEKLFIMFKNCNCACSVRLEAKEHRPRHALLNSRFPMNSTIAFKAMLHRSVWANSSYILCMLNRLTGINVWVLWMHCLLFCCTVLSVNIWDRTSIQWNGVILHSHGCKCIHFLHKLVKENVPITCKHIISPALLICGNVSWKW